MTDFADWMRSVYLGQHSFKNHEEALRSAWEAGAAAEREACAKVCEDIYNDPKGNDGYDCYYTRPYLECAAAIRSRT